MKLMRLLVLGIGIFCAGCTLGSSGSADMSDAKSQDVATLDIMSCHEQFGKKLLAQPNNTCLGKNKEDCGAADGCKWYELRSCNFNTERKFCDKKSEEWMATGFWTVSSPEWSHDCFVVKDSTPPDNWHLCEHEFRAKDGECVDKFLYCTRP